MPSRTAAAEIALAGLVTARWVLLALLCAVVVLGWAFPGPLAPLVSAFPTTPRPTTLVAIGLTWALVNVATSKVFVGRGRANPTVAGIHLLLDAVALTALLGVSGGAANPFTTLYFVPITLATQVSPRWTWALAGSCLACFGVLFVLDPIPAGPPGHHAHFAGHLRGMWVAFGVSGALITYFVHRIALSLARQRDELARLRESALEDRHLASIGSLAAGAAHELGTPLGTIGVLVGELPHMTREECEEAASTMKREVERCKAIMSRMATPDIRVSAWSREGQRWPLEALVAIARDATERSVSVELTPSARGGFLEQPREAVEQVVRELIHNAAAAIAARGGGAIELRIDVEGEEAVLAVRDEGIGMEPGVARVAFDPFFSTKPEGDGMGLGLYLVRAQLRQLGGSIRASSAPGRGTTMTVRLPLTPPRNPTATPGT